MTILTPRVLLTTISDFEASVDQHQSAQYMQCFAEKVRAIATLVFLFLCPFFHGWKYELDFLAVWFNSIKHNPDF